MNQVVQVLQNKRDEILMQINALDIVIDSIKPKPQKNNISVPNKQNRYIVSKDGKILFTDLKRNEMLRVIGIGKTCFYYNGYNMKSTFSHNSYTASV